MAKLTGNINLEITIGNVSDPEPPVWISTYFKLSDGDKTLFSESFEVAEEDLLNLKSFVNSRLGNTGVDFYRANEIVQTGSADLDAETQDSHKISDLDHNFYISGNPDESEIIIGFYSNNPAETRYPNKEFTVKYTVDSLKEFGKALEIEISFPAQ
jgi:hypothetical protein